MSKSYDVALLPGDGTGIEVAAQARRVLNAVGELAGFNFNIDEIPCGGQYYLEHGRDWPADADGRCRAADVILLGAVGWPSPDGTGPVTMTNGKMAGYSPVIGNRVNLDLYANIRPVKLFDGVKTRISGDRKQIWDAKNVDMVFLRENTEGLYSGIGGVVSPGGVGQVASDTRIITRNSSERVIRLAYEMATNMFGDIVTDLASVLQGGMGMAVGCNVGDDHAMFEPIHGSAPRHSGKDKVNPMAMFLATAEALRWLGRRKNDTDLNTAGDAIEASIKGLLDAGAPLTYDLVGEEKAAPMSTVTDALLQGLRSRLT